MKKILGALILFWFGFTTALAGDKIYQWVDENGVKHYSDVAPEGDQEVTVTQAQDGAQPDTGGVRNRKNFDKLVEQLNKETAASEAESKRRLEAEERRQRQEAEKKRQARLEKERKAILKQIELVEKRALSPTFTEGMRKAQLEKLKKQLQQLQ